MSQESNLGAGSDAAGRDAETILRGILYETHANVAEASYLASDGARESLVKALVHGLPVADADTTTIGADAGDVAGQALRVLAADPAYQRVLQPEQSSPGSHSHRNDRDFAVDPISFVSAVTLALVVLNLYVNLERDKKGRWTFQFRVRPASRAIQLELAKLVRVILEQLQSK